MNYSIIAILTVAVLVIINYGILFRRGADRFPAERYYRRFLLSIMAYLLTDIAWGLLYENHLITASYIDTVFYFITMALSVLFWTMFVVRYLSEQSRFGKLLTYVGWGLFILQILELTINIFVPIAFSFDANGVYQTSPARYVALGLQVLVFTMTAVYTLVITGRTDDSKKRRYLTIGLFGLAIGLTASVQMFFPLQPVYAVGCLLGGCVLHTFVVEDEKSAYLRAVEQARSREEIQKRKLEAANNLLYTDPQTGVNSKHAYLRAAEKTDDRIASGQLTRFALAVFDMNSLKEINDTEGHEAGDRAIVEACRVIGGAFPHSEVYRIGGDEFVAILEGDDYARRELLKADFEHRMDESEEHNAVVISCGIAAFIPDADHTFADVFNRADKEMYRCKQRYKHR